MQAQADGSGGPQSCSEVLGRIRRLIEGLLRERKKEKKGGLPIYWGRGNGFVIQASLGSGIGIVVQAFCDENGVPRIIGFFPGAIQAFHARGEDRLARFLTRLLEGASRSNLQLAVTSKGDLAAEVRVPVFALLERCGRAYDDEDLLDDVMYNITMLAALGLWISGVAEKLDELEDIPRLDLENPLWFLEEDRARLNAFNPI